jgi:hypothetical protein
MIQLVIILILILVAGGMIASLLRKILQIPEKHSYVLGIVAAFSFAVYTVISWAEHY